MLKTPKKIFLNYIIIIVIVSWIWAVDVFDWALENILTVCLLIYIFFQKRTISNFSYTLIALFLTLHIIGSHYAYNVPILNDIAEHFWLLRNHYDRIVHFSFGLCFTIPLVEYLQYKLWNKQYLLLCFIATFILFWFGALYEILEWLVVIIVAPEIGQAFLGSQWDIWDAQKDMWLWFIGSIVILILYYLFWKKNKS